jgi:hypothetical protein
LVLVAHALRVASESVSLAFEPTFVATTVVALAMFAWACLLLRRR